MLLTYILTHIPQPAPSSTHYNLFHTSLPLLTVPNLSTVFARRAFNYTAPTTWNSLPADILTCDSESGFKRLLKTHLFNNCLHVSWLTHSQRLCSSAYGALQICFWHDMTLHQWTHGWTFDWFYKSCWGRWLTLHINQLNTSLEWEIHRQKAT